MRLYFKEGSAIKPDEIASRQLHVLQAFQGQREKKLRIHDVKEIFKKMRDHV